jgi:HPt (histidine-containing phosphotransfer) domain-containing protein
MATSGDKRVIVRDPFAKRLMVRYLSRREDDVQSLRSALASQDFECIRKKGHNLFGSGSAYGLDRISELGAALESNAKKHNSEHIGELIETLEAFIRNVRVV